MIILGFNPRNLYSSV